MVSIIIGSYAIKPAQPISPEYTDQLTLLDDCDRQPSVPLAHNRYILSLQIDSNDLEWWGI